MHLVKVKLVTPYGFYRVVECLLFSVKLHENETGDTSYYILIGEAYIHGIMDGEVI